ncbi:MAG TPA: DUF892 family protein [Gammaproteobacteria bacterium]
MATDSLEAVYVQELKDLHNGNAQMKAVVREFLKSASDEKLRQMLETSLGKIEAHNESLAQILARHDAEAGAERCKGMEGLVREARDHALERRYADDAVRDAVIISQMQRMTHYGIAGYGTAIALARALGFKSDAAALDETLDDVYDGDLYLSHIAERNVNERAA